MNRLALILLIPATLYCASAPVPAWVTRRFNPEIVETRDVQGITERVVNGKLTLQIDSFLELVLRNSTDINISRMDVYTAADQICERRALCSILLWGSASTPFCSVQPQTSQIGGASTLSSLSENSFINYQELFPTGQTAAAIGFNGSRNSTNSAFNILNPSISGTLGFFHSAAARCRTATASSTKGRCRLRGRRSSPSLRSRPKALSPLTSLRTRPGRCIGDAVRARDNIKVLRQTFDLAQKSYDRDKLALDLGALAGLDIYQSETQVAQRKTDLVQAQYSYVAALDGLRRLVGADVTPEFRALEIALDDDPAKLPDRAAVMPYEAAYQAALRLRPEMDVAQRRLAIDDLNARIARNLMLPRVDLTVQGQAVGLGGNQVAVVGPLGIISPAVSGGLPDTLGQVFGFSSPGYGAGVQVTLPIRSTQARAQLADSLVARTRDRYTVRQTEQQIALDVKQAITSIDLASATIDSAKLARDLAQKNVDAEQQKYELGTITAFEVLDSQSRLSAAESSLLNAYVGYQEAFVNYRRATWTLLDGLGMVLETPKVN